MRTHVVLVPGFGGFDALGRLNYYYGTTPLFARAKKRGAALHYFENLPTASVCTRWLEHTDGDFLAIDDVGDATAQRAKLDTERQMWNRRGIAARSYATLGRAPFGEVHMEHALRSVPSVVKAAFTDALDTDLTYRVSYTACCDGPFAAGDLNSAPGLGGKGPFGEIGDVVGSHHRSGTRWRARRSSSL